MDMIKSVKLFVLLVLNLDCDCGMPAIPPMFPTSTSTNPSSHQPGHPPSFIVGGSPAKKGSYPWQANIRTKDMYGWFQFCSGTLINDRWVLSAGHCWEGTVVSDTIIGLGYYDIDGVGDEKEKQDFTIDAVIVHELYDDDTLENDVSLVKLSRPVTFTDYISPACLPDGPIHHHKNCQHGHGIPIVTGWGDTMGTSTDWYSLQQAKIPYIHPQTCNKWYNGTVYPGMFCLGYAHGGKDACQGDSGGPVVCQASDSDETYKVYGITSWGYGCAEPRHPGVYTRVHYYRKWIDNIIATK